MQFVVLIYIFIQVHLASDLLKAEQGQITALRLTLMAARKSGWVVQEWQGWDPNHTTAGSGAVGK